MTEGSPLPDPGLEAYFYSQDEKSLKDGTCHGNADTAFRSLRSDDSPHFHLFFSIWTCDRLQAPKCVWPGSKRNAAPCREQGRGASDSGVQVLGRIVGSQEK